MFWWIILALAALLLAALLTVLFAALAVDKNRLYTDFSRFYRALLYALDDIVLFISRVTIETEGMELLPRDEPFLLVCNHLSNYDPIVKVRVFRKHHLAFISKPENFSIPIVGRLIRRYCFMSINRQVPREAIATIQHAAELLKKGEMCVAVYPEGTRSRQRVLLPFHGGVFKIAQKAKASTVVCVVENTEKVKENAPFRRTVVRLRVLRTIPVSEMLSKRSSVIGQEVFGLMQQALAAACPAQNHEENRS